MITLHLTRAADNEGVYLKLPSSPAEIGEAFAELDAVSTDTATTRVTEAISNVYNLSNYLKNVDVEKSGELDKLSALARKMQTMGRDSCYLFEGVLDANSVNGLDDILRLSESLDEYALLPDAVGGSALGKYLVTHGMTPFPESVQPYLDYQIIGAEFYADHGGAFCRAGYVVRKEELPQQFLQTEQEQKSVMLLRLRASHGKQQNPFSTTLTLPAADELLERTRQRLGIEEFAEAEITTVDYIFPYFATMVPQDCITVESANALARAIVQMNQTDGELLKYLAAVELERPDTFDGALQIARNIDNYAAGYSPTEDGAWEESIDTGNIYAQLAATLGLTSTGSGYASYAGDELEYTISELAVTLSNNGLASGESEGYLANATLVLEIPTGFARRILPPVRMLLRVQAKYIPKF